MLRPVLHLLVILLCGMGAARLGGSAAPPRPRVSPPPVSKPAASCRRIVNVIVIGAGIAGVSAAHNLSMTGCHKVTILEARNRVGGRMYSRAGKTRVGGKYFVAEMGAQWIESARGNPITALARRLGLRLVTRTADVTFFNARGKAYTNESVRAFEAQYKRMLAQMRAHTGRLGNDLSVDSALRAVNKNLYLSPFYQALTAREFELQYGGSLTDISAWYYRESEYSGQDQLVAQGFDAVPKRLLREATLKGAKLQLNFEVTSIIHPPGTNRVQVTGFNTVTKKEATYTGDVTVITLPLGVLRTGKVEFYPVLSSRKRKAFDRVGVGHVSKAFFVFDNLTWGNATDELLIEDAQLPANRGRWADWVNLARFGQPALAGMACGDYASKMAGMTVTAAIADARAKVSAMFPRVNWTRLDTTWVQRWNVDPYSLGSTSYAKVGVQGDGQETVDYERLADPEARFLFAGEHTHTEFRSSVHGAYLSGQREAGRILQYFS